MITADGLYLEDKDDFALPVQQGPTVPSVDRVTRSMLYTQKFWQFATLFVSKPWSSPGPGGSYLVEESEPRDKGGGIVEFMRIFAAEPASRSEYSTITHNYQFIKTAGDKPQILEIPYTTQLTTQFDYFHEPGDPSQQIPIARAFRYVQFGDDILALGTLPGATPVGQGLPAVLHEDQTYSRWRGNIYERVSKYVPGFDYKSA